MSNAMSKSPSAPVGKAARSFTRFIPASVRPVVFKLSRKLSVTYWPGRRRTISAMLLALLSGFVPGLAGAGPTGGQVVAGSAKLLTPTSSTTQVNQSSQNVIINWQSFSIGAGEAVRFVQPSASAVALNRVIGSDPSRIFGTLQANGKVFLVNNAGVYFAPGASVDVGGLVATSMNIGNASFMSGNYKFAAGAQSGAVANDGQLRGAFVVLAAPQVSNAGSIVTPGGATALAAGGRVSLDIAGDKLVTMSVDAATANAAVVNSGSVSADGGKVFMSASSANAVLDTVINTSGIVRAGSIVQRNGQIVIDGGAAGVVKVGGTLAASGAGTGLGGGAVKVLGEQVALLNGARIDVSGDSGGGSALVGGDLHGAGAVKTAATARVEAGAVINADALASGNGGKVVVWADRHTDFAGAISARGGAQGGDGGFVETSGKATLAFAGKVVTTAPHGATGNLLLDPTDITIDIAASSGGMGLAGGTFSASATSSTLDVNDLTAALGSTNVTVDTASAAAGSGHIVVATDVNWANGHNLTLKAAGDITNNAHINANGGGAINLFADGNVTAGTLTSGGGPIAIAGNAGGSSRAASVIGGHILSAGGNVTVNSIGPVTTGEINAGSGTILVASNAGVGIDAALSSSDPGVSAIIVTAGAGNSAGSASGGDITVSGPGSVTAGGGGRATLYTGSIAGSTGTANLAGAGTGNFRYNSAPGSDNFTALLGNGVQVVYREQPTLTISGTNPTSTYGDVDPVFGFTYAGLQNGDTFGQAVNGVVTVNSATSVSTSGHTNAGAYAVVATGGAEQLGYNLVRADGTFTVDKKALTATVSAPSKVYDGTPTAAPTLSVSGLVGGETINVSASATFNSKDVATANQVTVDSVALIDGTGGGVASNYTLGTGQNVAANITPKALTATLGAADKAYDGGVVATAAMNLTGMVGTESVTATGTGVFDSKDVLTATNVTVSSVALANGANGGMASNYSVAAGQSGAAHITPALLTASVSAPDKVYDGDATAAPAIAIVGGLAGSEGLGVSGTGTFNSKDVLTANQVTVQSVALVNGANGGLASNYSLATGQSATAHITPKALTATAVAPDKVYDGDTQAAPTVSIVGGLVGAETVNASASATFNSKDVLTANQVTVDTVTLADGANGGIGSNYSLGAGQTATAHITPKALTVTVNAADKVYDGDASASGSLDIASGLVGSEIVNVNGSATFNSKDVLSANLVTVQSLALVDGPNGGLASNYSAGVGQTATAHITPKSLTASVAAPDKVYDGSTTAAPVLTIASGLVGTETVTASGTGVFDSKDVLGASQVTVQSVALVDGANGGMASNYDLAAGQTAAAHITPKALTASVAAPDKTYDGGVASSAVMNLTGMVGAETVTGAGTGTFNSKDVLTANQVTIDTVTLADGAGGGIASNYSLGVGQTGTAYITPKALTATAVAADKTYDGSMAAAPTVSIASGLVGAETVNASGTGAFNSKDVLAANQVTVDSVTLADGANGGLASNYSLAVGQTATAHITPKALTATAVASDKVYDGDALAAPTVSIVGGLVGTETVNASASATFNTKDVLTANQVTVDTVTLADGANGGIASNYSLGAGQTATAHITPKALTVTVSASDKVYDGDTNASGSLDIASGLVGSETVTANGSATFNSKDVLGANLVTVQSLALADGLNGGLASNYSVGVGQTTTAHITPKSLTASAAAADKVYDGGTAATAVMNIDASGLVGAETVTGTGSGVFDSKDVVGAGVVTVQSVALADGANGGLASNYSLGTGQTGAAHITPQALTAGMTAADKVYDGNTTAAPTLAISAGLVGTEMIGVTGTATFNSKDVLSANLVTANAVSLADGANGGLASNYSLASGQSATAHITAKALGATVAAPDKTYDGSLVAAPTVSIASGLVGTETLIASGTGTFNSKDVLAANLVTLQSVALADGANGGLASNYSLAAGQSATAHITPKALTAAAAAADKVYDGNLGATAVMNIAAAGLVDAETVTGTGTGVFNSKDVLAANQVTVQAVTLADGANGGLASNYSLGTGQTGTAHITRKALTATAVAPNKVYDGNLVAAPVLSIAGGLVGAEMLGVSAGGTFNSKDVLAANTVTVNSVALANGANGGIASNYSLASGQTAAAHVTPKALSATVAASGKVYDGNTNAANVLTIASGLVGAETVNATGAASFNSKDVLTANQVTVQSAALTNGANGGLASNYSLAPGQVATNVHITAKALTATAAAADKVYDGNLAGSAVMNIAAAGLVGSETVSATGTGQFNSKDVGSAGTVTINTVQLVNGANGGLASNYSLGAGQVGAAKITRRPSVTWIGGVSGNWADAANWEVGAIPDLANVANVIIPAGKTVTFDATVPSQKGAVQLDSIDGAGALVVGGGNLNVANALRIGSYAQSAGEVDTGALGAGANFNQTGGKLVVSGNLDIVQAAGSASLADLSAANLSLSGHGATQAAGNAVLVSDTVTLDTGAGDVLLGNQKNDFGKVVIVSAHDVTLRDINALDVKGAVGGTLTTGADTLSVGPTTVGGNFVASAHGLISQSGALDVAGATIIDSAGTLRLDDKHNALRGRVKVNAGGDALLASAGGLTIGGDVGGKLVLTAAGPVVQGAGDALHVTGASSIDAGTGAVTLTEADNHFGGPLSVTGGALSVVDKGALALGQSSVAGNLSVVSGGALTQTGKLAVSGASNIAARGQAVTLDNAANSFGGKMTLAAASATVNAAGPLAIDSDVDGSLTLGSPELKLAAANALNLHLNTGAATVSAGKSVSIDGGATGPLALSAGGAVTQAGALVVGGTTSISAPGQAISLANAGNDFGGELSLTGAAAQVADKNALVLGSVAIVGNLQLTAKGDLTQKGALNVSGATAIESTGAVVLGNEGNDFVGPVSATAASVMLRDRNVLTVAKLTASKAELSAGSELQVAPGGIVDAPDIALSLSPTAVKGAIGTPANKFEVRRGARVVLGANTPAVPTYIGGDGAQVVVGNLAANINYSNEAWSMDARTRVNSSIANILQASQKKADSNVVLIERGLLTDLTMPIPYPHEGAMRTKGPACIGNAVDCPDQP